MFGAPPRDAPNSAKNPQTLASDLLTFTTDARSAKIPDLLGPGPTGDVRESGGGGPVEAVFWIEGVRTQWRVRGDSWVIGPDIEGGGAGAEAVETALKGRMRGSGEGWGWERERVAHFWGMNSEQIKRLGGAAPGMVISGGEGEGDGEVNEEEAKRNFRVVVVRPAEVECVDLTDNENSKRWIYTLVEKEGKGKWKREELYP